MRITIELPDELLEQVRRVARKEDTTVRALVEEGLRRGLETPRSGVRRHLDLPSYGGSGLTADFQGVPWSRVWDEVY